jgi:hypothetical protein
VISSADDSLSFHPLDNTGRAIVPDLQLALHEAGRGFALSAYYSNSLSIERVASTAVVLVSLHF